MEHIYCADCGKECIPSGCTTGYGVCDGHKLCYECCGKWEEQRMQETGKAILYLSDDDKRLGNWPGTRSYPILQSRKSRHNIGGGRLDVWFWFSGRVWHGIHIGEGNNFARCKRTTRTTI